MFIRLILQGLAVMSLVGLMNTEVMAGTISGWGFKCCSSGTATIDLKGVPNPSTRPTIVVGNANLKKVEILCKNPANNGIFPGNSFDQQITDANILDGGDITGKGKATINLIYPLNGFEDSQFCVNPNWQVLPDSAWLIDIAVRLDWFECNGDATDGDPCTEDVNGVKVFTIDQTRIIDTKNIDCSVPPGSMRDADGKPPHQITYNCSLIP